MIVLDLCELLTECCQFVEMRSEETERLNFGSDMSILESGQNQSKRVNEGDGL